MQRISRMKTKELGKKSVSNMAGHAIAISPLRIFEVRVRLMPSGSIPADAVAFSGNGCTAETSSLFESSGKAWICRRRGRAWRKLLEDV